MSNAITDQERNKIISDYMYGHLSDMCKAIERAVLAKAGEQEPIGKVSKSAECGGVDFYFDKIPDGETMLYAHPLPAQAIPENFIEAFDHILDLLEYVTDQPVIIPEPTNDTIMRSVKKIVTKLRSLSASPKP